MLLLFSSYINLLFFLSTEMTPPNHYFLFFHPLLVRIFLFLLCHTKKENDIVAMLPHDTNTKPRGTEGRDIEREEHTC